MVRAFLIFVFLNIFEQSQFAGYIGHLEIYTFHSISRHAFFVCDAYQLSALYLGCAIRVVQLLLGASLLLFDVVQ